MICPKASLVIKLCKYPQKHHTIFW